MEKHTYGYLFAVTAALLYAFVTILGKILITGGMQPLQLTFYQYLFTVIILGAWFVLKNPGSLCIEKKQIGTCFLLGILGGVGTNLLYYSALQYLEAGIAAMLLFIHPVYITIFFAVTRIKLMKPYNYLSVFLSIFGVVIVLNIFTGTLKISATGLLIGILSGVCYAFYNIFADLKVKEIEPNVINFYACTAALLFSALLLTFSEISFSIPIATVPAVVLQTCLAGIFPPYFFYKALQYIGSENISVISSLELPATLLLAFVLLGERMTFLQFVGVTLIIIAAVLLHRNEKNAAL